MSKKNTIFKNIMHTESNEFNYFLWAFIIEFIIIVAMLILGLVYKKFENTFFNYDFQGLLIIVTWFIINSLIFLWSMIDFWVKIPLMLWFTFFVSLYGVGTQQKDINKWVGKMCSVGLLSLFPAVLATIIAIIASFFRKDD